MKYHMVSVLLFGAAGICYMAGFNNSANGTGLGAAVCAAGVFCELSFWVRGLRKKTDIKGR